MKPKTLLALAPVVVGIVLALVAGSCAPERAPSETHAFIFAFEKHGVCQLRLGPGRLIAPPGDYVVWEVKNECGQDIEPEVHDFAYEGSPPASVEAAPANVERVELAGIFEPGKASRLVTRLGEDEIRLRIKQDARPGRYRYSFRNLKAPGDPGDPKIDIWPPTS